MNPVTTYLKLDLSPMSVNIAWQGRRFKTPKYKSYEQAFLYLCKHNVAKHEGSVEVRFMFHYKNWKLRDVDNSVKPALDCLVKAGVIDDDRHIMKVVAEKVKSDKDFMEIIIKTYEHEAK